MVGGPFRSEGGVVGCECGVGVLDVENAADAGQVDPGLEECGDALEPDQVVVAVAAGPACGTGGGEQPVPLVEPKRLGGHPGQLGGHRDAVDPRPERGMGSDTLDICCSPRFFGISLLPHATRNAIIYLWQVP